MPAAGSSAFAAGTGTYQLAGTGGGVGGSADAFHFAYYQAVSGDGQIVVRLASAEALAQAALVLRASLDVDAASAAVVVSGSSAQFVRRLVSGNDAAVGGTSNVSAPCWLKLVRAGSTIDTFVSADGQTWTRLGSDTLDLEAATIYVGLAVSNGSASSTTAASASFDNLTSTFLPAQGLQVWLKADTGTTADPTTRAVSSWADQSGHGNDALQSTTGSQPLLVGGTVNNLPALRFDGADDRLTLPASVAMDNFTIYVVARPTATHEIDGESTGGYAGISGQRYLFGAYQGQSSGLWSQGSGCGVSMGTNGVSVYEHAPDYLPALAVLPADLSQGFSMVGVEYQNRQPSIYVNGSLSHTGLTSPQPQVHAPLEIGSGSYGAFAGDVAEVLVYDHALNPEERTAVEAYLNARYAIVAPPASPTQLHAVALSSSQLILSWTETGPSATGYTIERQNQDGSWSLLATVGTGITSYIDQGLTTATQYAYRVTASNNAGSSPSSAIIAGTTTATGSVLPTNALQLWLRADTGVSLDASSLVTSWADQSGNGHDVVQASTGNRPTLLTSAYNGNPAVQFNGSSAYLQSAAAFDLLQGSSDCSIFVVTRPGASQPTYADLFDYSHDGNGGLVYEQNGNNLNQFYFNGFAQVQLQAGQLCFSSVIKGGTSQQVFFNGQLVSSGTAPSTPNFAPPRGFLVGNWFRGGRCYNGDIAELLIFNRALTESERTSVETYLNTKYAVVAPPDAPTALSVSPISASQSNLLWQVPVTGGVATGFSVERKLKDGDDSTFAEVAAIAGGQVSAFIDESLAAGSSYAYRVRAYNAAGYSTYSAQATIDVPVTGLLPASLPALEDLNLWLKPDVGVTKDANALVSVWTDASGHGNNATSRSGSEPTWTASAINGHPVLHFDGAASYLQLPSGFSDFTQGMTALVVARPTNTGAWQRFFDIGNGAGVDNLYLARYGTGNDLAYAAFNGGSQATFLSSPGVLTLNACQLLEVVHGTTGTVTTYKNGKQAGQGGAATINNVVRSSGFIGKSNWSSDALFQGDIAEVVLFNHTLTDAERQIWESYLNTKYQFAPAPPAPTQLQVTSLSSTQVAISWVDTFPDIASYRVERQNADGSWSIIANLPAGTTSCVATGLLPATQYTFRVIATNRTGDSPVVEAAITTFASGNDLPIGDLRLWLRADSGTLTSGSGSLSQWVDRSGLANHGLQGDTNRQPQVVVDAASGYSLVRFNGSGDTVNLPSALSSGMASGGEIFLVQRAASDTSPGVKGFARFGTAGAIAAAYPAYTQIRDDFGSDTSHLISDPAQALDQLHLYNAISRTGEWTVRINGAVQYTTATNNVAWNGSPSLGYGGSNYYEGGDAYFAGDIAEVLLFDRALTSDERAGVEHYLSGKYGLQTAPAAPVGLTVNALSPDQASVTWGATLGATATNFLIERQDGAGQPWVQVAEVTDQLSYIDAGLQTGVQYSYRVRASNDVGASGYSNVFAASTPATGSGIPFDSLRLWLKADSHVPGSVGFWADQSGRGNHAWENDNGHVPQATANVLNGWPTVHFSGASTDMLNLPDFMRGATQGEVVVVMRADLPTDGSIHGLWRLGTAGAVAAAYPTGDGHIRDDFGSDTSHDQGAPSQPLDQFQIYDASSQPGAWTARINGITQYTTLANNVSWPSSPVLGYGGSNYYEGGSRYYSGDVAEILVFDQALSDSQRVVVGHYLNTKYHLCNAPAAPANPSGFGISDNQASLTWSAPGDNGQGTLYTIERKGPDGNYVIVGTASDMTAFLDSGLLAGVTYTYRITATNAAGQSASSPEFSVTAPLDDGLAAVLPVADLRLWLRADAVVDGAVSFWPDQSGHSNHATQSANTQRPQVVAGAINGRPVVRFSGASSNVLNLPAVLDGQTPGDVFIVQRVTPYPNVGTDGFWRFGTAGAVAAAYPTGDEHIRDDFGSNTSHDIGQPNQSLDQAHLYEAVTQAGEWTARVNGVTQYTTTSNTVAWNGSMNLGYGGSNYYEGGSRYFSGDIAEVLVFDRALTLTERSGVERYLGGKYGLAIAALIPSNMTAVPLAPDQISLTWNAVLANTKVDFLVERQDGVGQAWVQIADLPDQFSYIDTGLQMGVQYAYRLRAANAAGTSAYAAPVAATTSSAGSSIPLGGLRLWLKADAHLPGSVAFWADQSNRGNHASQYDSGRMPFANPAVLNGFPAVHFDGSVADALNLPDLMNGAAEGEVVVVMRAQPSTDGSIDGFWRFGTAGYVAAAYPTGDGHIRDDFGSDTSHDMGSPDQPLNQFETYDALSRSGEWTARINGITQYTTSSNRVAWTSSPSIGYGGYNYYEGGNRWFSGDVAEVLVFEQALTPEQRQSVNHYLNTKYHLSAIPAAPVNPAAIGISGSQASLTWNAPDDNGQGTIYTIERKGPDGIYRVVGAVSDVTSFLDGGLIAGTTYTYRVLATNAAGQSLYSREFSVTTPTAGLGAVLPTANLRLWLKADAVVDGAVNFWPDQSGHGNHATQTANSQRPQVVAHAFNGRPAVRFDGTASNVLNLPAVMNGAGEGDVFIVQRVTPYPNSGTDGFWRFGTAGYVAAAYPAGDGHIRDDFGSDTSHDIGSLNQPLDQPHLYEAVSRSNEWTARVNGVVQYTTNANNVAWNASMSLGYGGNNYYEGGSRYFSGDIAEVLVFDRVLSNEEREVVNDYLNAAYDFVPAAPPTPTGLKAEAISPTQAALTWTDPAATDFHQTIYTIERASGASSFAVIAEVADATSFVDSELSPETTYSYRITARNFQGYSAASQPASATLFAVADAGDLPLGNVRLWLKADAEAAGAMGLWQDQSGYFNHARQVTTTQKPVVIQNASADRPAVHFDDSQAQSMDLPGLMAGIAEGEMFVMLRASSGNPGYTTGFSRFGTAGYVAAAYPASDGHIRDDFGSDTSHDIGQPNQPLDRFHLYDALSKTGQWTAWINGIMQATTSSNNVAWSGGMNLGYGGYNYYEGGGRYFAGDIAEVLVFDRALSQTERETAERYLLTKYGLASLPQVPTSLLGRALSPDQISLTWTATLGNEAIDFLLERKEIQQPDASYVRVADIKNALSYVDATVEADTAYTYRMRARTTAGWSDYGTSAQVSSATGGVVLPLESLRVWLKADAAGTGRVGFWPDLTGRGNHARQTTTTQKPQVTSNVFWGQPAVHFDGTLGTNLALLDPMNGAPEGEAFIVLRATSDSPGLPAGFWRFGTAGAVAAAYPTGAGRIRDDFGGTTSYDVGRLNHQSFTESHLYNAVSTPTGWMANINGNQVFATNTNTVAWTASANLGYGGNNYYEGGGRYFSGDIAEVMLFERALTPSERRAVEWYLAAKYLIPGYDLDGDGLTNKRELALGTNPFEQDTNGDGIADGVSVDLGINPLATGGFNYTTPPSPTGGAGTPPADPSDHTPPVITLTAPADAVPLP